MKITKHRRYLVPSILLAIGIAGSCVLLKATHGGLGFYSDSHVYVETARNFSRGLGVVMPQADGKQALEAFFPPGYAIALSVGRLFGIDPLSWSRGLNAIVLSATTLLLGWILRRQTRRASVAIGAALAFAFSVDLLSVHAMVWSEPLFLFLSTASIGVLARDFKDPTLRTLCIAGVLAAAAWLTRYAGVAWVVAETAALAMLSSGVLFQRLTRATVFGAIATGPMIGWILLTHTDGQGIAKRVFTPHVHALVESVPVGFNTVIGWFLQKCPVEGVTTLHIVGLALLAGAGVYWIFQRPKDRITPFLYLIVLVSASYVALLLIIITFFDASTTFDYRLLSPLHVCTIMLLGIVAHDCLSRVKKPGWPAIVALGVAALFLPRGFRYVNVDDQGYAAQAWRDSPLLQMIKTVPLSVDVYSNVPYPVIVYADRFSGLLPTPIDVDTRLANSDFEEETEVLNQKMKARRAVVAFFNNQEDEDNGIAPAEDYRRRLQWRVIKRFEDGTLYGGD